MKIPSPGPLDDRGDCEPKYRLNIFCCQGYKSKKVNFFFVNLKKWLRRAFKSGLISFLPMALLASAADACVLFGIREFMNIVNGKEMSIWQWILAMIVLILLRTIFLYSKTFISESFVCNIYAYVLAWFLHRLRILPPQVFHTNAGNCKVESAYEAVYVLKNNCNVYFTAMQAILQLTVFFPVLLFISWPLALFLFAFVVPVIAVLQRKLHKLGPAEQQLLQRRASFRNSLLLARKLFRKWSSANERSQISKDLLRFLKRLKKAETLSAIKKENLSILAEAISVIAMVLVLAFCALLMQYDKMNANGLVLFASAVLLCYKPVKECSRLMPQFRLAASATNILENFENLQNQYSQNNITQKNNELFKIDKNGIKIDNKNFMYQNSNVPVFCNLNINWPRQKPILIRGKNGIGKSTLLRLLAGLERWNNNNTKMCSGVFFVSQDLDLPPLKMLRNLLHKKESEILERFINESNTKTLIYKESLSGGERARIALLWALASDESIILLDEPFASIALADREILLSNFLNCANVLSKWVIIVSHDAFSLEIESLFYVVHF